MKFLATLKNAWRNRHWDIDSQLRESNEESAARHKQLYEALTGKVLG